MSKCHYCGVGGRMTIDHVIPYARGGKDEPGNRVKACKPCNEAKGSDWPTHDCSFCRAAIRRHIGSRELRPAVRVSTFGGSALGPRCNDCGEITMTPTDCPWCKSA